MKKISLLLFAALMLQLTLVSAAFAKDTLFVGEQLAAIISTLSGLVIRAGIKIIFLVESHQVAALFSCRDYFPHSRLLHPLLEQAQSSSYVLIVGRIKDEGGCHLAVAAAKMLTAISNIK
ncbi:hypothetical protein ACVNS2_11850 [Paenibacillus caseinilyticus]|uniref:Uncharacterized protein n=1 Tax=Paenibacillus mucilaginosus K02 TaxID=997761 RepID=I0BG26_9BACL|nr:hypothetical protein [Paenibacillus mucilaginosus]AFH61323.1 hypothetical protein B2K_11435 [Paenibacillus mucilaginosus K02]